MNKLRHRVMARHHHRNGDHNIKRRHRDLIIASAAIALSAWRAINAISATKQYHK